MWSDLREGICELFEEAHTLGRPGRIWADEGLTLRRDLGSSPEYLRAYFRTPAGRAARKRYNDSENGRARRLAYAHSEAGKAAKRASRKRRREARRVDHVA